MIGERSPSSSPVTGVMLAGGASRRMGRDKRGVLVDGIPMLRRALQALAEVVDSIVIVEHPARPLDPGWLGDGGVVVVRDRREGGPLAGLEAGLGAAGTEWALVVGADMPWLHPKVLRLLRDAAATAGSEVDVVALESSPGIGEPLAAAYRSRVQSVVSARLDSRQLRLQDLLAQLRVALIEREQWMAADPSGRSIVNVNAPEDLEGLPDRPG